MHNHTKIPLTIAATLFAVTILGGLYIRFNKVPSEPQGGATVVTDVCSPTKVWTSPETTTCIVVNQVITLYNDEYQMATMVWDRGALVTASYVFEKTVDPTCPGSKDNNFVPLLTDSIKRCEWEKCVSLAFSHLKKTTAYRKESVILGGRTVCHDSLAWRIRDSRIY